MTPDTTIRDIRDAQWALVFLRVGAVEEERIRQLLTAERHAVNVAEQVKAINWVACELGAGTTIGGAVLRLGELIERGDVRL